VKLDTSAELPDRRRASPYKRAVTRVASYTHKQPTACVYLCDRKINGSANK